MCVSGLTFSARHVVARVHMRTCDQCICTNGYVKPTMLTQYKEWVKRHPSIVQNLDWLLLLTVWNPSRTNGGFEFTYEAYHAAVGLLSLWHQSVLEEGELPTARSAPYLWLDAIEYLETLIELRGMHLEQQGKMSRYAPLMVVETIKAVLKMTAWSRYSSHMFLRRPIPDDLHQFESELGLQDVLRSLQRLHLKYTAAAPEPASVTAAFAGASAVALPAAGCPGTSAGIVCGTSGPTSTCASPIGGGGRRESYGLREYLGSWARPLASARWRRAAAGGGTSCVAVSGCEGCMEVPRSSEGLGLACGTSSGPEGCSTSGHCGAAATHSTGLAPAPPPLVRAVAGLDGSCACSPLDCAHQYVGYACSGSGSGASGLQVASGQQPPSQYQSWRQWHGQWQHQAVEWSQHLRQAGLEAGAASAAAVVMGKGDPDVQLGRNLLWLSELLHIWRPVVYVTLLKRYGRRSWRPWTTSLVVDLLSGHFHRRGQQHLAAAARAAAATGLYASVFSGGEDAKDAVGKGAPPTLPQRSGLPVPPCGAGTSLLSLALARSLAAPGVTAGEDRELYDRRRKMLLYALRSPFLEATTLSWLAALRGAVRHVPLLGFGADYVFSLVDTFTAYYSYTSGSN